MRVTRPADADQVLDVRALDGEPFSDIMDALQALSADDSLLLISSFEPTPLYGVLAQRGFEHETSNPATDEWHVEIERA